MPFDRNLTETDEPCPDCSATLKADEHDRLWCRACGERKYPA